MYTQQGISEVSRYWIVGLYCKFTVSYLPPSLPPSSASPKLSTPSNTSPVHHMGISLTYGTYYIAPPSLSPSPFNRSIAALELVFAYDTCKHRNHRSSLVGHYLPSATSGRFLHIFCNPPEANKKKQVFVFRLP